jgi:hypothetical protein
LGFSTVFSPTVFRFSLSTRRWLRFWEGVLSGPACSVVYRAFAWTVVLSVFIEGFFIFKNLQVA